MPSFVISSVKFSLFFVHVVNSCCVMTMVVIGVEVAKVIG